MINMIDNDNHLLNQSPLGKSCSYISQYQPDLLFTIPRQLNRKKLGIHDPLPFHGKDIWNAYELSWLNKKGKPMVASAEFVIPGESSHLIESKSFKLYLNSFNHTVFDSFDAVKEILMRDLSHAVCAPVAVTLFPLAQEVDISRRFQGICLDDLDITCDTYTIHPQFLTTEHEVVTEILYSDLLKSNCLVTKQPDWGSVQIAYTGKKIQHEGLLKYIVSFRNHNEFHEPCVERMFVDILNYCAPEKLFIYARYTRRGGLDINPYRANYPLHTVDNMRLYRQ
jgi:7-cyano-7-deazaguanine reductase